MARKDVHSGVVDLAALAGAQGAPAAGQPSDGMGAGADAAFGAPAAQPRAAGQPAASQGATVAGPLVVDLTPDKIQQIAQTSTQLPVLIVFLSARSAASETLAESLVALARATGGRFQLVRADVDAHPEFAQAFGIRGLPSVVAMLQGQLAPLFEGAPSDEELQSIIEQVLAAAAQNGLTGTVDVSANAQMPEPPAPAHHREAQEALDAGDLAGARAEFEAALRENPGDSFASTGIAQVSMLERLAGADVAGLLAAGEAAELSDVPAQLAYGDALIAVGNIDGCFARLIDVVRVTSGEDRDAARLRLIDYFDILGGDDPRVQEARRALASALF